MYQYEGVRQTFWSYTFVCTFIYICLHYFLIHLFTFVPPFFSVGLENLDLVWDTRQLSHDEETLQLPQSLINSPSNFHQLDPKHSNFHQTNPINSDFHTTDSTKFLRTDSTISNANRTDSIYRHTNSSHSMNSQTDLTRSNFHQTDISQTQIQQTEINYSDVNEEHRNSPKLSPTKPNVVKSGTPKIFHHTEISQPNSAAKSCVAVVSEPGKVAQSFLSEPSKVPDMAPSPNAVREDLKNIVLPYPPKRDICPESLRQNEFPECIWQIAGEQSSQNKQLHLGTL